MISDKMQEFKAELKELLLKYDVTIYCAVDYYSDFETEEQTLCISGTCSDVVSTNGFIQADYL